MSNPIDRAAIDSQEKQQKPMFWVRLCSDGCFEGPIHNTRIDPVRKTSGAWHPLYLHPQGSPEEVRKMLSALQAGEMSVSRAVELLEMWLHGAYSNDDVPEPPADSALITDDKFPMELVRELRAELAAMRSGMERAWQWMDRQSDQQSKGGHATFDLMTLREEREALRAVIDAATLSEQAPMARTVDRFKWDTELGMMVGPVVDGEWVRYAPGAAHESVGNKQVTPIWAIMSAMAEYREGHMFDALDRGACLRAAEALRPTTSKPAPVPGFGIAPERIALLLKHSGKPEEINGDQRTQHLRVTELIGWMARHTQGHANTKWLAEHAYELAWYIASNGVNRHIDALKLREDAFVEGFNTSGKDRDMLVRINPEKFKPQNAVEPIAWINEDELPSGYPYDAMFPFSKVDGVRLFPVFGPKQGAQ